MGKCVSNATAIEVDDAILLAAGKNDAAAKGILALGTDQSQFQQPFQGITQLLEMWAQIAATRVADAEFCDQSGVVYSALGQILNAFRIAMQFELIKGGGVLEELCAGRQFLLQVGEALAKGEMLRKLNEANQVASLPAPVAIEQVLARVNVEAGASVLMQGTESHELGANRGEAPAPVVPLQVREQRNALFQLFQILTHSAYRSLQRQGTNL